MSQNKCVKNECTCHEKSCKDFSEKENEKEKNPYCYCNRNCPGIKHIEKGLHVLF